MARFVFLSNADTGGQSTAIARAINKNTKHEGRCIKINDNYIHFPYDICRDLGGYSQFDHKFYDREDIIELIDNADYLIFDTYDRFYAWNILFEDLYPGKKVIYRHNGDQLRKYWMAANYIHRKYNDTIVVSTPDLLNSLPRVEKKVFIPNSIIDYDYITSLDVTGYSDVLTFGHSPTQMARKGTTDFIDALGSLAKEYPLDLNLIAFESYYTSLKHRSQNTCHFDQMTPDIKWYGNASVESSLMGQPVFVNELCMDIDAPFMYLRFGRLRKDLEEHIQYLLDESNYKYISKKSKDWVKKYHNPETCALNHVSFIERYAVEWERGRQFVTDALLLGMGVKWNYGKGEKIV